MHLDGDWHRTFHCWIVGERDGRRFVLFQLRGADKDVYPGMLDITAAGHPAYGETARDGLRELHEELGLSADFEALVPLGTGLSVLPFGRLILREFCDTFLLRDDRELAVYRPAEDEVAGLVEVGLEDALRLFAGEVEQAPARALTRETGRLTVAERSISAGEVVPPVDRYYLKVCIMAERLFEGRRYFGI